ncbi:C2H2 finger domain protein [Aspergillus sp. HF37]|nr:C2H2 finger domain protein [Aspergillus sp. HF37]
MDLDHALSKRPPDDSPENDAIDPAGGALRKRKRSRKIQPERKFECTFEGCGKSYSRAEHLYRHQLNHTPKQIYECDFPDCHRSFVRQDLCIRHRERHTTRGSQLQKRDSLTQVSDPSDSSLGRSQLNDPSASASVYSPLSNPPASSTLLPAAGRMDSATPHSIDTAKHVTAPSPIFYRPDSASNHTTTRSPTEPATPYSSSDAQKSRYASFRDRRSTHPSIGSGELTDSQLHHPMPDPEHALAAEPESARPVYPISTGVSGASLAHSTPYDSRTDLQMPVGGYSDLGLAASTPTSLDRAGGLNVLESAPELMTAGPPGGDIGFDPISSCAYPIFGGETYNRSPFAMADDFAAWLFNEPAPGTASMGYPSVPSVMPGYMEPAQFQQNPFYLNDPAYGNFFTNVIPHHPMSVTSILDPGSPRAIMSEDKRQELLHLMATRFNESAYSSAAKRKDALMDGDLDDDHHVLSLRMMQTYVGSYWHHFHGQLPILHRPTFSADKTPNLLLLAVMAIGAATLDKIHGKETTETAAELANFIAWHLRWEIFMDADFRPPAKLWIFQGLLLLEVYEKMLSTRALHERAHIHHDTTLTLMRRGSSLIGRSASDSPGSLRDDRQARSTSGSVAASDFVADESWSHWIKAEATRRVAFAAFVLDSTHATMFGHSAKMVAHELRLPLPCDEALWSATSAGEVARVQSSLQANGVKPTMFLDGLKRTLNGSRVRTNAFGRTILMAGLLSVSWHMNQRDLQVSSLGVPQALGGRDKWRSALLRAFDNWRRDVDEALGPSGPAPYSTRHWARRALGEDSMPESRDVLHGLAHMASHVDVVDCQIFAGAGRLMGRSISRRDFSSAREKMTERWATKASARDATFYALKILSDCLLRDEQAREERGYSARDDTLLNRPWVLYIAALVVWCYGYALDGPIQPAVELSTAEEQRADMESFLRKVGGVREPNELETVKGRNRSQGLLMVLREKFGRTRWELLDEAGNLLGSCIEKLRGV